MLTIALLLAVAQQTVPVEAHPTHDVVVTGSRLEDTERAWKKCRARDCPADQEIEAALAHGENLFVAGDYPHARSVLNATIDHTRGAEKRFPVEVADLRRAEARVISHMGEDLEVRRGMLAAKDALAKGLGRDDPRVLAQRLQVADAMMIQPPQPRINIGDARPFYEDWRGDALRTYRSVADDAERLDLPNLRGRALIRIASLLVGLAATEPQSYDKLAQAALQRLYDITDPRMVAFRDAAKVLGARLAARNGDPAAIDRLVAAYRGEPSRFPVLLYAPPIDWADSRDRGASVAALGTRQRTSTGQSDEWADISFRIDADGRVSDVEALRQSRATAGDWLGPVLAAVRARRYAPLALEPDALGSLRIERHTYTASFDQVTGSRLRAQTGIPRVVVTDMTIEPQAVPSPAKG